MDIRADGPPGPLPLSPCHAHRLTGVHRYTPTTDGNAVVATRLRVTPDGFDVVVARRRVASRRVVVTSRVRAKGARGEQAGARGEGKAAMAAGQESGVEGR